MESDLIRKTNRRIGKVQGYEGACVKCGARVTYSEEFMVIEIANNDDAIQVVPIDAFFCPYCDTHVHLMTLFKSLEVTDELRSKKEKE